MRRILPEHGLSTDIIVGYPGETEEDFQETLSAVTEIEFDSAFMFAYSEREGTFASRKRPDDVPDAVKKDRLKRLIALQESISKKRYGQMVGREVEVMVQGPSRRNAADQVGRTSCFKTAILPDSSFKPGTLVSGRVVGSTSHTLFVELLDS